MLLGEHMELIIDAQRATFARATSSPSPAPTAHRCGLSSSTQQYPKDRFPTDDVDFPTLTPPCGW
jgi:hypothetical protein